MHRLSQEEKDLLAKIIAIKRTADPSYAYI
jgi:hypothetical protein